MIKDYTNINTAAAVARAYEEEETAARKIAKAEGDKARMEAEKYSPLVESNKLLRDQLKF